ncbi:MAG: hypothetical protein ACOZQL_42515 [Myxococcota bacterium]
MSPAPAPTSTQRAADSLHRLALSLAAVGARPALLQLQSADDVGTAFLDQGRLSWAAVRQTRRYLSRRLEEVGVSARLIEETRRSGRPLSALVGDVISQEHFAELLFDHSLESLDRLITRGLVSVDEAPSSLRPPPISFALTDVVCALTRRVHALPAPELEAPPPQVEVLQVARVGETALPARVLGTATPTLRSALELCARGAEVLSLSPHELVVFRRGARCWSVLRQPDHFVVSRGSSPVAYAWMLRQEPRPQS